MTGVLSSWLGLPTAHGRRRVMVAMLVDSLGEGLFLPFFVVFLIEFAHLPATQVGIACTISAVLVLPVGPLVGRLVDSFGPIPVIVVANLVRAASCVGFLLVGNVVGLVVVNAISLGSGESFWTANSVFISDLADPGEQRRWFTFQRALRNVGVGAGAVATSLALLLVQRGDAYVVFLMANAASYLIAAALVATTRTRRAGSPSQEEPKAERWLRAAIGQPVFRAIALINVIFVIGGLAPDLLWTYDTVNVLRGPVWLPGVLFGVNTAIAAALQLPVNRAIERLRPAASLRWGLAGWAASFVLVAALAAGTWPGVTIGFLAMVSIYSAGELLFGATINALAVRAAPEHLRGRYLGLYQLSWTLSSIIAPVMLLSLSGVTPSLPWLVLAGATALGVLPLRALRGLRQEVAA